MTLKDSVTLVTGATGFMGGTLTRKLADQGAQVRALARSPERAVYISDTPGVEIVTGDITNTEHMKTVMQGCDYVFHVAVNYRSRQQQQRINVDGTRHVTQAAAEAGVRRLVHVSSVAVYGYSRTGLLTEADALTPTPYEPYSQTKTEAESVIREISTQSGLSYSIIRPGMIYGPRSGQWTDTMFRHARRRPIVWVGDGSGATFPIHINDVIALMLIMAVHPAAYNEIFNCVYPTPATWRDFLGAYARLVDNRTWLGVPVGLVKGAAAVIGALSPPALISKALPHVINTLTRQATVDMHKAQELLGWQPQIDLQTGVETCVPYLREKGLLK